MNKTEVNKLEKAAQVAHETLVDAQAKRDEVANELSAVNARIAGFDKSLGKELADGGDRKKLTDEVRHLHSEAYGLEKQLEAENVICKAAEQAYGEAVLATGQAKVELLEQSASNEILAAQKAVDKIEGHAEKIHDIQTEARHVFSDEILPYLRTDEKQVWEYRIQALRKPERAFNAAVKSARYTRKYN